MGGCPCCYIRSVFGYDAVDEAVQDDDSEGRQDETQENVEGVEDRAEKSSVPVPTLG